VASNLYVERHYAVLRARMLTCRLSQRQAASILAFYRKIESTRGAKELVNIMKLRLTDLLSKVPTYKRHNDGTWVGPLRPISRLARRGRKGLVRACRVLRLYGLFQAKAPTKEDWAQHARQISARPDVTMVTPEEVPQDKYVFEVPEYLFCKIWFKIYYLKKALSERSTLWQRVTSFIKGNKPALQQLYESSDGSDRKMILHIFGDDPDRVYPEKLLEMLLQTPIGEVSDISLREFRKSVICKYDELPATLNFKGALPVSSGTFRFVSAGKF